MDSTNYTDEILTQKQASKLTKFSTKTLQKWRCIGKGPKFIKISSKAVRYRLSDIQDWLDKHTVLSTSDKSIG